MTNFSPRAVGEAYRQLGTVLAAAPPVEGSPAYHQLKLFLRQLPLGAEHDLVVQSLALLKHVHELAELPAHLDDAIFDYLRTIGNLNPDAAFVRTAMGLSRDTTKLHRLLKETGTLPYVNQLGLTRDKVTRRDLVPAAQVALAMQRFGNYPWSRYLLIVVSDGSEESIDILMPYIDHQLKHPGRKLDWFLEKVLRFFSDKPAAQGLVHMLQADAELRAQTSRVRLWAKSIGIANPPPVMQFTMAFRNLIGQLVYQVRVDSTKAQWLQARRAGSVWSPREPRALVWALRKRLPFRVRCLFEGPSKGLDKVAWNAWADECMGQRIG